MPINKFQWSAFEINKNRYWPIRLTKNQFGLKQVGSHKTSWQLGKQCRREANCSTSGLWGSSMCKRPHCAHVFCHYRCMFLVGARKIWMVVNDLFIPIPRGLFCHLFIWRTFLVCCVWRSTCPHNFSLFVLKAHFSSHSPSWFSMQLQGNERRDFTGTMRAWWSGQLRLFGILLEDF